MERTYVFRVGPLDDGRSLYVPIGERDGKPIDTDPVLHVHGGSVVPLESSEARR